MQVHYAGEPVVKEEAPVEKAGRDSRLRCHCTDADIETRTTTRSCRTCLEIRHEANKLAARTL